MKLIFTQSAFRQFQKLNRKIQKRIDEKLRFYFSQQNPLKFAEPLKDFRFGSWRFRIGNYRIIFDVEKDDIIILRIGHRKDIYK